MKSSILQLKGNFKIQFRWLKIIFFSQQTNDAVTVSDSTCTSDDGELLNLLQESKKGKSRTEPDQDQQNLENLGPNRTRTNKIWKILDRIVDF